MLVTAVAVAGGCMGVSALTFVLGAGRASAC